MILKFDECKECKKRTNDIYNCIHICDKPFEALEKFNRYKKLEEQGRLLKLPCKPHDKLYWISDQDEDAEFSHEPIEEVEVCNIDYNGYSLQLWFADKGAKEFPVLEVSSIGEELFYSREEAEAALKELEG